MCFNIYRPIQPRLVQITQGRTGSSSRAAVVDYNTIEDVVKVFETLKPREPIIKNMDGKEIKFRYGYDKKKIESEKWVGVVLRNLPPECTSDMLIKNLSKDGTVKILSAESV